MCKLLRLAFYAQYSALGVHKFYYMYQINDFEIMVQTLSDSKTLLLIITT